MFYVIEITGNDMNEVYAKLPRLNDEITLARLINEFLLQVSELYNEIDADFTYEKLSEEKSEMEKELVGTFRLLFNIYRKYDETSTEENLFRFLINFNKYELWNDLYSATYKLMVRCIERKDKEVRQHMIVKDANHDFMTMLVNLVPSSNERNTKQYSASEHIYIARSPSSIIYNQMNKQKGYKYVPVNKQLSYKLHKFAITTFKPNYVFSAPLESIQPVFDELVNDGTLKLVYNDSTMREKLPIVISGYTCHVPTVVYKVKRPTAYNYIKRTIKK